MPSILSRNPERASGGRLRLPTGRPSLPEPAELELLFLSAGFEIAQQYGDYRFVRFDRTSPYVVTVARRPRRSGRRPYPRRGQSFNYTAF